MRSTEGNGGIGKAVQAAEGGTQFSMEAPSEGVKLVVEVDAGTFGEIDGLNLAQLVQDGMLSQLVLRLEAGANPNDPKEFYDGKSGFIWHRVRPGVPVCSPLWWAALFGYDRIVDALLDAGADAEWVEGVGPHMSVLHMATGRTNCTNPPPSAREHIVAALVAAGAAVDLKNDSGKTPLHAAIETRQTTTAKQLLRAGADPNLADRNHKTPFQLAQESVWGRARGGGGQQLELIVLIRIHIDQLALCAARQRLAFALRGKSNVQTVLPNDVLVIVMAALAPLHYVATAAAKEVAVIARVTDVDAKCEATRIATIYDDVKEELRLHALAAGQRRSHLQKLRAQSVLLRGLPEGIPPTRPHDVQAHPPAEAEATVPGPAEVEARPEPEPDAVGRTQPIWPLLVIRCPGLFADRLLMVAVGVARVADAAASRYKSVLLLPRGDGESFLEPAPGLRFLSAAEVDHGWH